MTAASLRTAWRRACRTWGAVSIVLGVLALFFPDSATAGTETPLQRGILVVCLILAGFAVRGTAAERRDAALTAGAHYRLSWYRFYEIEKWIVFNVVGETVKFGTRTGSTLGVLAWAYALAAVAAVVVVSHAWWVVTFLALLPVVALAYALLRRTPETDKQEHEPEHAADIIESVAIAFVYALVVREFTCEAFKIPTGSMQPTIMGEQNGRRSGDHLLAGKAPLLFCDPQRWSIVVFKYPLFRQTNYIKRLIGLPGERLEIRDGDIYANGKIVAKPDDVQETLWFPLLPLDDGEWPGAGVADSFRKEGAGDWRFEGDGATGSGPAGEPGEPSWIVHDRKVRGGWDVGVQDSRVSFDLDPSGLGDGAVFVRLDGGGRRVEFEARRGGVWMTAPGVARTQLDVGGLGESAARWSFSVADRVVRVARNGRQVARVATADLENLPAKRDVTWLGVTGGTAKFTKLRLERDLQYTQRGGGRWDIPLGCYFMLGDNTTASRDSREWQGKMFRLKDGREYVCDQSDIRLDDDHSAPSVRVTPDGAAYELWDSYGAHRIVAKSDLVGGGYKTEPQPFVRREDLVGRAFFIFFPLKSEGTWRPRILP